MGCGFVNAYDSSLLMIYTTKFIAQTFKIPYLYNSLFLKLENLLATFPKSYWAWLLYM